MKLSYKYDGEMNLIELYCNDNLVDEWYCDEEPAEVFRSFITVFMAGYNYKG